MLRLKKLFSTKKVDEIIIQVDKNNKIIGSINKLEAHLSETIDKGIYHRAFSFFLTYKNKEILLQRRSSKKITFPGFWSNTVCSHPQYNSHEMNEKDYIGVKRAIIRRMREELGLKVDSQINEDKLIHFGEYLYQCKEIDYGESECSLIS